MKLKLSFSEFTVLYHLLLTVCTGIQPKGIQAHILHGTLFRLFKKFHSKSIESKKRYTISMEDDMACAFYLFYSQYKMTGQDVFTINLVTQINNSIHQKYSNEKRTLPSV